MDLSVLQSLALPAAIILAVWILFSRKGILFAFSSYSRIQISKWLNLALILCSFALAIALWDLFSRIEPEGINKIPGPVQTITAAGRLIASGKLLAEAGISCLRILIGFLAASIVGVSVGLIAGSFLIANRLIVPVTSFLRYIPPTAFISLLIVYFGIGEAYKYTVIFFGVIFFIIQMVIDVVDDIDKKHIDMAITCGLNNWAIFYRIIVPCSSPRVLDVLRINLSAAWTFLVAAELIGADRGLGYLISVSQRYLRIDELYVGILTFGLIGFITDLIIERISRTIFRWHYVALKK